MTTVIGVRFRDGGKTYFFSPGEYTVAEGDGVIVETSRGTEFGDVITAAQEVEEDKIIAPLKEVVRVATPHDREQRDKNRTREKEAYEICVKKIVDHKLEMKLVDVEYSFNGSKVVFYFTADGRVDFRELVKDLAGVFKTRIELRQIGVRDEAKMLGGLGSCGRPVCCKSFLADFTPVSIKMAKEQNLSLSPTKISGICGRLMCCLKYEQDCYESMRRQMPKVGKDVQTPDGFGSVVENNVITERTKVRVTLADGTYDMRDYPFRELQPGRPAPGERKPEDKNTEGPSANGDDKSTENSDQSPKAAGASPEKPGKRPADRPERAGGRRSPSGRRGQDYEKADPGQAPEQTSASAAGEQAGAQSAE